MLLVCLCCVFILHSYLQNCFQSARDVPQHEFVMRDDMNQNLEEILFTLLHSQAQFLAQAESPPFQSPARWWPVIELISLWAHVYVQDASEIAHKRDAGTGNQRVMAELVTHRSGRIVHTVSSAGVSDMFNIQNICVIVTDHQSALSCFCILSWRCTEKLGRWVEIGHPGSSSFGLFCPRLNYWCLFPERAETE